MVLLCQRSEIRGQRSEVRSQKSEVRSQKSEVRSQKSEVRSQKSEVRSQKSEVRSQKSEVRSQKSEVRSWIEYICPRPRLNGERAAQREPRRVRGITACALPVSWSRLLPAPARAQGRHHSDFARLLPTPRASGCASGYPPPPVRYRRNLAPACQALWPT